MSHPHKRRDLRKSKVAKTANGVVSQIHLGVIAQKLKAIFELLGQDSFAYGILVGYYRTAFCMRVPSDSQSPATPLLLENIPLAGYVEDFNLQVTRVAAITKLVTLQRNALCLVHA